MELLTTEEQQVEAIKKWWKDNWASVVGGVVIGIAIVYGGRMWMETQQGKVRAASTTYEAMIAAVTAGQKDMGLEFGSTLMNQYPASPYAVYAALASASIKLEQKDAAAGRAHLQWALDHASDDGMRHITRIRLARLMLGEGQNDEALRLIDAVNGDAYQGSYDEIRGDLFLAKQQPERAREAYASALQHLDPAASERELVQMKLDNLGAGGDSAMQAEK